MPCHYWFILGFIAGCALMDFQLGNAINKLDKRIDQLYKDRELEESS